MLSPRYTASTKVHHSASSGARARSAASCSPAAKCSEAAVMFDGTALARHVRPEIGTGG